MGSGGDSGTYTSISKMKFPISSYIPTMSEKPMPAKQFRAFSFIMSVFITRATAKNHFRPNKFHQLVLLGNPNNYRCNRFGFILSDHGWMLDVWWEINGMAFRTIDFKCWMLLFIPMFVCSSDS